MHSILPVLLGERTYYSMYQERVGSARAVTAACKYDLYTASCTCDVVAKDVFMFVSNAVFAVIVCESGTSAQY
jgi:hypothetical protein